jgi:hypothetical protein
MGKYEKANPSRGGDAKPGVPTAFRSAKDRPAAETSLKLSRRSQSPTRRPFYLSRRAFDARRLRHTTSTCRGDMGTLRATGLSALLTVVLASTSFAQQAQTRDGFWIGGGLGYGSLGLSCEGCADVDRTGGISGYAKLGMTVRPNVLLGVEMNGWTKSEGDARVTLGNFSGAAYWYPMASNGLFVKAGAGYSALSADAGTGSATDTGFGLLGGVGYDIRMGRNMSITPVANYFRGGFDGGSANVLQIGVGVTSH